MANLSTIFGFGTKGEITELPEIFKMPVALDDFVNTDMISIYSKILTDVVERTHGIPDDSISLLWDNCLKSESSDGLITLLSKAMAEKKDLFLIYDKAVNIIREATQDEAEVIKQDYKKKVSSPTGAYISFKNYRRTDMVKLYSALEYCSISSLYKSMNLSKAIQIRINKLRGSVSLTDSTAAKTQAQTIAKSLGAGEDILLDSEDEITTASPDMSATKESTNLVNHKRAFYLGFPESYITGILQSGLGDTGQGDTKAVDRGLKNYYFSVIKPVLELIFGIKTTFKSSDTGHILPALETLKTFELVSDDYVSKENKISILNRLLDLDNKQTGKSESRQGTEALNQK